MFVSVAEFEISVPTRVQMAVYGEAVLLSCTFPVSGSWDAGSSVITWQRQLEVVHTFFHGRDQLQYQSPRYTNRTSLFHQEMKKGNASLRLDRTTLEDAGEYTCSISTQLGSQMKSFGLKVAAFYPEPRLHIFMLNDGHVEVQVTSEGGYPSPSLQWLMGNESDVTNDTRTQLRQDQHTRLSGFFMTKVMEELTVPLRFSLLFTLYRRVCWSCLSCVRVSLVTSLSFPISHCSEGEGYPPSEVTCTSTWPSFSMKMCR
ncbi:hypothetical protein PDJAM_G00191880 [Pangasius djambal]|uniref:Uncharacterized protein n=1 Tax=Pangasius djambal TaxID=1691987 RepID=A0ACC5Y617_9TELE|nr:hypothetical protein [Pangasius djambal]